MKPAVRLTVIVTAIVALAAAAAVGIALIPRDDAPAGHGDIVRIEYRQQKAVPDFDGSLHVVTEPKRLRDLAVILDETG